MDKKTLKELEETKKEISKLEGKERELLEKALKFIEAGFTIQDLFLNNADTTDED